jgi:F-type H+-transporting ATPase subunit a
VFADCSFLPNLRQILDALFMPLRPFFGKFSLAIVLILSFFLQSRPASADELHQEYNSKEIMLHHVLDQYTWEFFKKADGTPFKVELPRILYDKQHGKLAFFKTTEDALEVGFTEATEFNPEAKHGDLLSPGGRAELDVYKKELEKTTDPEVKKHLKDRVEETIGKYSPIDFSITKNVIFMFLAAILLLIVFISAAKGYKKNEGKAPKGIQAAMEPVVVFVREEIAKENIPVMYERFMPLLLTMFFFILFLNLLGMVPFSSNVSGNISFTLSLALVTLFTVNLRANKAYWKHILWPPVPHAVKVLMVPLEIIGIFTKPFALTIRLFANITGGHIIMVSLIGLIFIFGKMGEHLITGYTVGVLSSLFIVAISCLELFVALLQAYVFTLLTAVFIGQAVAVEEHH